MGSQSLVDAKSKRWSYRSKRDLQMVFKTFNPCSDKDWESVADILAKKWTVEELKSQARKQRLKPLTTTPKRPSSCSSSAVERIRKLIPNNKIPQKGTVRHTLLEEELHRYQLVLQRSDDSKDSSSLDFDEDSDEESFLREAFQNHALVYDPCLYDASFTTPSKSSMFFPKVAAICRLEGLEAVGDDFSMPADRSKLIKYRNQYRAQQFNRRTPKRTSRAYGRHCGESEDEDGGAIKCQIPKLLPHGRFDNGLIMSSPARKPAQLDKNTLAVPAKCVRIKPAIASAMQTRSTRSAVRPKPKDRFAEAPPKKRLFADENIESSDDDEKTW